MHSKKNKTTFETLRKKLKLSFMHSKKNRRTFKTGKKK